MSRAFIDIDATVLSERESVAVQRAKKITLLPESLFYLLVLLLPFEELGSIGGWAVTKLVGVAFFLCSLLSPREFYGKFTWPLAAFGLYSVLGCLWDALGASGASSFNELTRPVLMCALVWAAYNLAINRKGDRLVLAIWVSSFIYAIAQLLEFRGVTRVESTVIDGLIAERVAVLGGDENFAACFISLSILAGGVYALNTTASRRLFRLCALFASGVGFLALLKTGSRGGLAALLAGTVAIVLTVPRWGRRLKYLFVLTVLLGAMTFGVLQNNAFKARIFSSLETGENAGRTYIWSEAVRMVGESPVFGFGFRTQLFKLGERTGHDYRGTHNLFLSVLLSAGVVGLALFLYFYFKALSNIWTWRAAGLNPIVFAWFVMALAGSLCINTEIAKWFWLIVALALGAAAQGGEAAHSGGDDSHEIAGPVRPLGSEGGKQV